MDSVNPETVSAGAAFGLPSAILPAWVLQVSGLAMRSAHQTLDDALARPADFAATSPSLLAAASVLQQVGGLMQGLPASRKLLAATSQALQELARQPSGINQDQVESIRQANFALLAYATQQGGASPNSPMALFPAYRKLQQINGALRIHPADLWHCEWRWLELPDDELATALDPIAARLPFEAAMLSYLRVPEPVHAMRLGDQCAGLAAGQSQPHSRTFWQLAAALFEAQVDGLLTIDLYVKRAAARLLTQLRQTEQGDAALPESLAIDLLFFCLQAAARGKPGPRLQAMLSRYGDDQGLAASYEDDSGLVLPDLSGSRQAPGSALHQLRADLTGVERQADACCIDPSQTQRLMPLAAQLSSMRKLLSEQGLDQAALACLRIRVEVEEMTMLDAAAGASALRPLLERHAANLGALAFVLDLAAVDPVMAKRLMRFNAASGNLEARMDLQTPPLLTLVPAPALHPLDAPAMVENDEAVRVIGSLRISIALFNVFLNESDELSRHLCMTLAEWASHLTGSVPAESQVLAQALAGNAEAVGFRSVALLAGGLAQALGRAASAETYSQADGQLFVKASEDIRYLLHQFAAGFLRAHDAGLLANLQAYPEVLAAALPAGQALI